MALTRGPAVPPPQGRLPWSPSVLGGFKGFKKGLFPPSVPLTLPLSLCHLILPQCCSLCSFLALEPVQGTGSVSSAECQLRVPPLCKAAGKRWISGAEIYDCIFIRRLHNAFSIQVHLGVQIPLVNKAGSFRQSW